MYLVLSKCSVYSCVLGSQLKLMKNEHFGKWLLVKLMLDNKSDFLKFSSATFKWRLQPFRISFSTRNYLLYALQFIISYFNKLKFAIILSKCRINVFHIVVLRLLCYWSYGPIYTCNCLSYVVTFVQPSLPHEVGLLVYRSHSNTCCSIVPRFHSQTSISS